jgi:hypothetical protein
VRGRGLSGVYRVIEEKNNTPEVNKTYSGDLHRENILLTAETSFTNRGISSIWGSANAIVSPCKTTSCELVLRRLEGYTQLYYTSVMRVCQEKILSSYGDH